MKNGMLPLAFVALLSGCQSVVNALEPSIRVSAVSLKAIKDCDTGLSGAGEFNFEMSTTGTKFASSLVTLSLNDGETTALSGSMIVDTRAFPSFTITGKVTETNPGLVTTVGTFEKTFNLGNGYGTGEDQVVSLSTNADCSVELTYRLQTI
jgi:hypothetical protein